MRIRLQLSVTVEARRAKRESKWQQKEEELRKTKEKR
jgi:hypothetical protein